MRVCMHEYMHTHTHARERARTHTRTHAHTHTQTHTCSGVLLSTAFHCPCARSSPRVMGASFSCATLIRLKLYKRHMSQRSHVTRHTSHDITCPQSPVLHCLDSPQLRPCVRLALNYYTNRLHIITQIGFILLHKYPSQFFGGSSPALACAVVGRCSRR